MPVVDKRALLIFGGAAAVAAAGGGIWALTRQPPQYVQGQIEGRQISVSPRLPARVARVLVREGDTVQAGQLLATLSAPSITALTEQTQALAEATRAESEAAEQFRPEHVEAARALYEQAGVAAANATDSYRRAQILYDSGVVSREELKLAQTTAAAARGQLDVTRENYDLLRAGPRPETREALAALRRQSAAGVRGAGLVREDTLVTAPSRGIVQEILVNAGESALPGTPLMTLRDPSATWVAFDLPESRLAQVRMGGRITGRVPALGGREIAFRVTYVAPLADFATERPTSASGGFDVRQFEIHAEPLGAGAELRPGMSVLFPWRQGS